MAEPIAFPGRAALCNQEGVLAVAHAEPNFVKLSDQEPVLIANSDTVIDPVRLGVSVSLAIAVSYALVVRIPDCVAIAAPYNVLDSASLYKRNWDCKHDGHFNWVPSFRRH